MIMIIMMIMIMIMMIMIMKKKNKPPRHTKRDSIRIIYIGTYKGIIIKEKKRKEYINTIKNIKTSKKD